MICTSCGRRIRIDHDREIGIYIVCNQCYRKILHATGETGQAHDLAIEELAFEASVDQRIAWGA